MRLTSYRNLLWIIALGTTSWIVASAQVPSAAQAQSAVVRVPSIARDGGVPGAQSQPGSNSQTSSPTPQPMDSNSVQSQGRVETASLLPDSASLLPVAALVGFSFLLGGIVCGTIKTRH